MKKNILFLSILFLALVFSNCSSDDNSNEDDNPPSALKPSSYTVTESDGDNLRWSSLTEQLFLFLNYYAAFLYTCIGVLSSIEECILLKL